LYPSNIRLQNLRLPVFLWILLYRIPLS
jgi:hypothetical protein